MRAVLDGTRPTRADRRFGEVKQADVSGYCGNCGIALAFAGFYATSEVCSRQCWEEYEAERQEDIARQGEPVPCAGCGTPIIPGPRGRATCSDRCRTPAQIGPDPRARETCRTGVRPSRTPARDAPRPGLKLSGCR
jgi:hypothetical protein